MKTDRSSYVCGVIAVVMLATGIEAMAQDHAGHQPAAPEHDMSKMVTLFPARDASGTAWQPDVTPMNGIHRDAGAWSFMGHANIFGQFLYESPRSHTARRRSAIRSRRSRTTGSMRRTFRSAS
ncbi:MAG: hypothetical protein Q7R30_08760 [Acidobacteriota bacterium]|nr:hypothetical protein [Acidobacteriota bacterium]